MNILFVVFIDLVVLYLLFGHGLVRRFAPESKKTRLLLKDYRRHLWHLLRRDRDILPVKKLDKLQATITEIDAKLQGADPDEQKQYADGLEAKVKTIGVRQHSTWLKEYFEIFIVAVALAFGIRGLFLQPFKIPTGSMQPTLYGIHSFDLEEPPEVNVFERTFDYVNYTRRYFDETVKETGPLTSLKPASSMPFFPVTSAEIAGVRYRLPGDADTVSKYLRIYQRDPSGQRYYEEGQILARGYIMLGDHLFVDRTRYSFAEPRRGDITVFLTDGIRDAKNKPLGGRYYIKRLVGLPGDTLKVVDRRLYVKPEGTEQFRLLDGTFHPAFDKIYSMEDGYRGYSHEKSARYLTTNSDEFHVPEGHYFMLGDNTENSRDSRYWGTVPRENLVGRACFVWWPFTKRWGLTDRLTRVEEQPDRSVTEQ